MLLCVLSVGSGDDVAYLWSLESDGSENASNVIKLEGHKDTVASVGFNFDGTLALTGSYDGTVKIWNALTGSYRALASLLVISLCLIAACDSWL